jgi:hypothetical protein
MNKKKSPHGVEPAAKSKPLMVLRIAYDLVSFKAKSAIPHIGDGDAHPRNIS